MCIDNKLQFFVELILRDVFKLFGEPGHTSINNGKAIVAGWGRTLNNSRDDTVASIASTPKLQKLEEPVISIDECIGKFNNFGLDLVSYIR